MIFQALLFLITALIIAIILTLHISVFLWTKELEKQGCECSNMWQRDAVNGLAVSMLVFVLFNTLVNGKHTVIMVIKMISGIVSLVYFALLIDYISKLKAKECECSEDWRREFAYIYSIVWYSFLTLSVLLVVFAGVVMKKM